MNSKFFGSRSKPQPKDEKNNSKGNRQNVKREVTKTQVRKTGRGK